MQAEIERMRDEITILRAVACDCVTEISPEGREETRCGSQQMMNALSPQDPMRWPIPCDVRIGSTVIKRGVRFEVLVSKMRYLYRVAERSTGASGGTASGLDERLDQINLWCL